MANLLTHKYSKVLQMHPHTYKYDTVLSDGHPHYYITISKYFQAMFQTNYDNFTFLPKYIKYTIFVLLAYKSTYYITNFLSNISTFHYLLIIVILDEATYKILKFIKTINNIKLLIKYHK